MNGKKFYQSTFDEVKVSDEMMAKLMLLNNGAIAYREYDSWGYRILKGVAVLLGFLMASGTLFSVPLG